MIDVPRVLTLVRYTQTTGREWICNGDGPEGLVMVDGGPPPTLEELQALETQAEAVAAKKARVKEIEKDLKERQFSDELDLLSRRRTKTQINADRLQLLEERQQLKNELGE